MWRGVFLRTSSRGGVTAIVNIAGVYEVWREVRGESAGSLKWSFCGKVEAGQTGKLVRSFVESSGCGDQVSGVECLPPP